MLIRGDSESKKIKGKKRLAPAASAPKESKF